MAQTKTAQIAPANQKSTARQLANDKKNTYQGSAQQEIDEFESDPLRRIVFAPQIRKAKRLAPYEDMAYSSAKEGGRAQGIQDNQATVEQAGPANKTAGGATKTDGAQVIPLQQPLRVAPEQEQQVSKDLKLAQQAGKATEKAGQGMKAAGSATKAAGSATKAVGTTTQAAGAGIQAGGAAAEMGAKGAKYGAKAAGAVAKGAGVASKGIQQGGAAMAKAGAALSSTGLGAIVGVPLAALGGVTAGAGAAGQAAAKAGEAGAKVAEKGAAAAEKGAKKVRQAGKKVSEKGKQIKDKGQQIKDKGQQIKNKGQQVKNTGRQIQQMANKAALNREKRKARNDMGMPQAAKGADGTRAFPSTINFKGTAGKSGGMGVASAGGAMAARGADGTRAFPSTINFRGTAGKSGGMGVTSTSDSQAATTKGMNQRLQAGGQQLQAAKKMGQQKRSELLNQEGESKFNEALDKLEQAGDAGKIIKGIMGGWSKMTKIGSAYFLQAGWACTLEFTLTSVFWLGLGWVNLHFIMKYIVNSEKFCEFGEESTLIAKSGATMAQTATGTEDDSADKGSNEATKSFSATLKWIEIIGMFFLDIFALILVSLFALVIIVPVLLAAGAMYNLISLVI